MEALTVAIVDDEPPARDRLRALLAAEAGVAVVGEARNADEAIGLLNAVHPDVVLLDVQMPRHDGFSVLRGADWLPPAVIFVTAFDQHAVSAFEVGATDYLLKPVRADRLAQALTRARKALEGPVEVAEGRLRALAGALGVTGPYLDRLAIRSGRRVRLLRVADIDSLQASGNYIHVHAAGAVHVIRDTMARMEERLDPGHFVRIHRSAIVNVHRVKEIEPHLHGDYRVKLEDGRVLTLSRNYRDRFRGRFGPEF
jgi:two-component system LytT family response regulator